MYKQRGDDLIVFKCQILANDLKNDVDMFREYAEKSCYKINNGHLLAIESENEYDFIRDIILNKLSNNLHNCFW